MFKREGYLHWVERSDRECLDLLEDDCLVMSLMARLHHT